MMAPQRWPYRPARTTRESEMKLKPVLTGIAVVALLHLPVAHAQSNLSRGVSNASLAASAASGLIVHGSAMALSGAGQLAVASIQVVGESTVVVLRGVSGAVELSVRMASGVVAGASLVVGTIVTVVAEAAGSALLAAGKLIAFVPNEAGRSLLYQARLR